MKRRHVLITAIAGALILVMIGQPVWAGSKQRHRWEGVAIGLGAAVLGSALLHQRHYRRPIPDRIYLDPPPPRCRYWDYEEVWVPPAYEREWRPGRYNRWGRWIPGRWERSVVSPGHWEEQRVCRAYR